MGNRPSTWLLGWDAITRLALPLLRLHLKRRVQLGKEHPKRWREKLGETSAPRPEGPLIWMHGVGLGEVLALRGMIELLAKRRPDVNFLVTSGTKASAEVFAMNLPAKTVHQFAPIDVSGPVNRFLDHWQPVLAILSEQDIWPGIVCQTDIRDIPIALINARADLASFARRRKFGPLYRDVFSRFCLVSCQDRVTAQGLETLGAKAPRIDGSLKPLSAPLAVDEEKLSQWKDSLKNRFVWVVGSSHDPDENIAMDAHLSVLKADPNAVLIIAPRVPDRGPDVIEKLRERGMSAKLRSKTPEPEDVPHVYVADTFGEMGLWYRLANAAFIGGTFNEVEGHNPWEARVLDVPVAFGPRVGNFAMDFEQMVNDGVGRQVNSALELADLMTSGSLADLSNANKGNLGPGQDALEILADDLIVLLNNRSEKSL